MMGSTSGTFDHVSDELKFLRQLKMTKGQAAATFHLYRTITGSHRTDEGVSALRDPSSQQLLFGKKEIKEASLNYCHQLLQNHEVDDSYRNEIYIENLLHYFRANVPDPTGGDDESCILSFDDFQKRISAVGRKNKEKY